MHRSLLLAEITPNYKVIPSAAVISRTHPHKSSSWIGYQQDNSGMRACAAWCMESGTNVISSDHNAGGYCKGFFTRHSGGKNCQKIENVVMEPYDQIYDSNSDLYWKECRRDGDVNWINLWLIGMIFS